MITDYAASRPDVRIRVVDVAPRWRDKHDVRVWKRVIVGGLHMVWQVAQVLLALLRGCRVVHIATSGNLGIVRDRVIMALAALFRVPVMYHIRFGRAKQWSAEQSRPWRALAGAMRRAHTVIPIDQATEQVIRTEIPAARVRLIPNCVDFRALPKPGPLGRELVFLGWIIPAKGIEELVRSWSELQLDGWRLRLIGPGERSYIDGLLQRYSPSHVEFCGEKPHDEAMQILATAGGFVFPSYTEGFPNAVVEAMALGRPIVASSVGAIPEMLESCGVLVPPRETEPLKRALAQLTGDERQREELGKKALERAQSEYELARTFEKLLSLWREAAGGS